MATNWEEDQTCVGLETLMTLFVLRLYTFIDVLLRSILIYYLYKNHKLGQM